MVFFVASHGAVFCLCSCWPWAWQSGLGIPSFLCASAFIHECMSHIALPRAHSGFVLCRVLLDPTSYCSSPEQKPALPLVVLLVLKVLLPPVLRATRWGPSIQGRVQAWSLGLLCCQRQEHLAMGEDAEHAGSNVSIVYLGRMGKSLACGVMLPMFGLLSYEGLMKNACACTGSMQGTLCGIAHVALLPLLVPC